MRELSWFEAFLVGIALTVVGLLARGLALSASRESALMLLGTFAAIAALTALAKLLSRLGRRKGN